MTDTQTKLQLILGSLSDELFRAYLYNGIARALRERNEGEPFTVGRTIFMGAYYSCLRECLLTISKLILVNRESISFSYLVNYVEQNPQELSRASSDDIRSLTSHARTKLQELEPLANKLKSIRDRELAHIDKIQLTRPGSVIPIPIGFSELDDCLKSLEDLLNRYEGLSNTAISAFQDFYSDASQELNTIFNLMK